MHNFIAICGDAILITLILNIFISWAASLRLNTVSSYSLGVLPRLLATMIIILLATELTVYKGSTLVEICRGIFGDLSLTTLFIGLFWLRAYIYNDTYKLNRSFAAVVMVAGIVLYLSVFGIIPQDIYGWAYFPDMSFMLVFGIVQLYLWRYARCYAYFWLIALIAFYFKLEATANFWDYLFDPLLWVICLFRLCFRK